MKLTESDKKFFLAKYCELEKDFNRKEKFRDKWNEKGEFEKARLCEERMNMIATKQEGMELALSTLGYYIQWRVNELTNREEPVIVERLK